MSEPFNGWPSWETWLVHLHITSFENSYGHWIDQAERLTLDELDEALKLHFAVELDEAELPMLYRDILGAAFREVNWREIAKALMECVGPVDN